MWLNKQLIQKPKSSIKVNFHEGTKTQRMLSQLFFALCLCEKNSFERVAVSAYSSQHHIKIDITLCGRQLHIFTPMAYGLLQ